MEKFNSMIGTESQMTQKFERETIALIATILVFTRALFPRPFIDRRSKTPYENQLTVRLCYIAMGIFLFFVWLGIHSEWCVGR